MPDAAVKEFLGRLEREHRRAEVPVRFRKTSRRTNFFAGFSTDSLTGGGRGGFDAGKIDRFTDEWNPGTVGPNRAFMMHGARLRERAWDLYRNNPYAYSAVEAYLDNVVECGIFPKPQYADREARRLWQSAWNRWGGLTVHTSREADISGVETVYELQRQSLREVIVGGGVLRHYVELPRRGRTVPLAIELIGEERLATHLNSFGANPKTANPVVHGVEIDPATGRQLAYHVFKSDPNDLAVGVDIGTLRIPATDAEYCFFRRQRNQHRGVSLLRTAILWLWALGYYTDAELKASDVKANWAYMITTDPGLVDYDWNDLFDSDPETGPTDIYGNRIEKHEPGMIWRGAPGDDIKGVGPNVPQADSLPWIRLIQMSISIGMGLSYQEVMRDYSQSNFHSSRAASARDRKTFRPMQRFVINRMLWPDVRLFTQHASRAGLDGFPRPSELQADLDEWLDFSAQAPGWESANPREDAISDEKNLANGATTLKRINERRGLDWEEELEQQAREAVKRRELEEANNITLASASPSATALTVGGGFDDSEDE